MKTFSQFLDEANAPKKNALKTISKKWENRHKGMTAYTSEKDGNIRLKDLFVPPDQRNKKIGSRFMKGLSKYADKTNQTISLRQSPEKGKEKDLNRFYSKKGFKHDSNKPGNYVRKPNKS